MPSEKPKESNAEEVKRWIDKAEHDFKTAEYNYRGKILDATIFYAQQSVEKALKSLLIKTNSKFPSTHDLVKLATICDAPKGIIGLCAKINPAYTTSRYPDVEQDYTDDECRDILNSAMEVLLWIKKRIH